jgi:hypothetical protein
MRITISPALTKTSFQANFGAMNNIEQSSLTDLHSSMVLHAVSVIEAHTLLFEVYRLLWQSIRYLQCSSTMSQQPKTCTNSTELSTGSDTRKHGPPDPEPPAAPPYVLSPSNPMPIYHRTSHTKVVTVSLTISNQNHHPVPIW